MALQGVLGHRWKYREGGRVKLQPKRKRMVAKKQKKKPGGGGKPGGNIHHKKRGTTGDLPSSKRLKQIELEEEKTTGEQANNIRILGMSRRFREWGPDHMARALRNKKG